MAGTIPACSSKPSQNAQTASWMSSTETTSRVTLLQEGLSAINTNFRHCIQSWMHRRGIFPLSQQGLSPSRRNHMGQRNLSLRNSRPFKITSSECHVALQQMFHHRISRCFVRESNYYPLVTSNKSGAANFLVHGNPNIILPFNH